MTAKQIEERARRKIHNIKQRKAITSAKIARSNRMRSVLAQLMRS